MRSISLLGALLVGAFLLFACGPDRPSDATPAADSSAASPTAGSEQPSTSSPTDIEESDDRTLAEKLSDATVETKVKRALMHTSGLGVFSFRPTVVNGRLILRGDVNTPSQYRRAERAARQVEGVTALTNRLTMGGRPVTNERLASAEGADSGDDRSAVHHTVRPGETLWEIAREYRAPVEQIRALNDLRSDNLRPGQRIRVR